MKGFSKLSDLQFLNLFLSDHPKHVKALDGLRGVAVLFVLLSHSSNMGMHVAPFLRFEHTGKAGVYLFFLLSAFLLDHQIAIAFIGNKIDSRYWAKYFIKRFIRIYPAYFVALLFYLALSWTLNRFEISSTQISNTKDLVEHLLLITGKGHFWSIPTEMKYYLLSPLIMYVLYAVFRFKFLETTITVLLIIMGTAFYEIKYGFSYISVYRYLPIFLVGMWLAIFIERLNIKKALNIIDVASILSMVIIFITMPFYFESLFGISFDYRQSILFFPYTILWAIVLVAVLNNGWLARFFEFSVLRIIGVISFSVYLYHKPLLVLVNRIEIIPMELKGLCAIVLSLVVGGFFYLIIERPIQLKRNFIFRIMGL